MGIAALIRGPRPGEAPVNRAERIYDIAWLYPLFFGYWSISALVLYTFAGERMPWLTGHLALPMILLSGWVFGRFLGKVEWSRFGEERTWALLALVGLSLLAAVRFVGSLLGAPPPFRGMELQNLRATNGALASLLVAVGA